MIHLAPRRWERGGRAVTDPRRHTTARLRRLARQETDGRVACWLLALANALDGMSRETAAGRAGMDRQTLRDWVIRFNAERDRTGLAGSGRTLPLPASLAQLRWHP
jgi:hypothetical protein